MQKVLQLFTDNTSLREGLTGWNNAEDPENVINELIRCQDSGDDFHIGMVRSAKSPSYSCILEALSDGWKLLGPPIFHPDDGYLWFLVKD